MSRTSDLLIEYCFDDEIPRELSVLCDYFGPGYINDFSKLQTIFGIYQGLVKFLNVDADMLHKALISNNLNKLIHDKYKYRNSGYYNEFCSQKIVVGMNI